MKAIAKRLVGQAAAVIGPHRWPSGAPRLWILMYHRIIPRAQAVGEGEEPGMFVTPETFARHLAWIGERLTVVRLSDWVRGAQQGAELPPRACAITFDDGWQDNFEHALPLLRNAGLPATVFAVAGYIGTPRRFWPNRIALLLKRAPEIVARSPEFEWLRDAAAVLPRGYTAALEDAEEFARLIASCKRYPDTQIEAALDTVPEAGDDTRAMLDWNELNAMLASGVFDVGSHTSNHVRLRTGVPQQVLESEIGASARVLEERTGQTIDLFCYPNGDSTAEAEAIVQRQYRAAVTTRIGINDRATPLFALRRIGLHEDVSHTRGGFFARLACWL